MTKKNIKLNLLLLSLLGNLMVSAQDTVHYSGATMVNVDYHHGELEPVVGVHNIQVFRANREHPEWAGGTNWTYNHAPMLAYWNNKFYLEYLSDPVGEHVPPGQTLLLTSTDGYNWSAPVIIFPPYKVPDGTTKEGRKEVAKNLYAAMHQRIGFFTAKNKHLLAQAYYGLVMGEHDDPNDGNGIGRVVREIFSNGTFGPVYFIHYNHAFNEKNTSLPFYTSSKDKAFVEACNELLSTPLMMQQWVEESDRNDPLIPLKKDFKAFNYYHLKNGSVVGLWKYALTSISKDEGKTWLYGPVRAPQFVNANAKIWGQQTSDGKYATVYNPSEFRWPLALSVSEDGLDYKNLLLVNGEITSLRYGGAYKSYGPQYVRGIQEIDGVPPDKNMWVTYSMNKEDIWVSKIPVPIRDKVTSDVNDVFSNKKDGEELNEWNLYSPLWCKTIIQKNGNEKILALHDSDPFDFAKAERVFPATAKVSTEISLTAQQNNTGSLEIEMLNAKGTPCLRLVLDSTGILFTKQGYRNKSLGKYGAGENLDIKIELNTITRFYTVTVNNNKPVSCLCFAPVQSVERIVFRTGAGRRFPDADTPTDQGYDLINPGEKTKEAVYLIRSLKITTSQK